MAETETFSSSPKKKKRTSFSAVLVMVCTFTSRILGFVRMAIFSHFFGAGPIADALNFAFNIPNNLRKLMAEGALTASFIPVFSDSMSDDKSLKSSKLLFRELISFQLLILIPVSIVAVVFAEPIVGRFLSDFKDPETLTLAVSLFRYMFSYITLVSLSAIMMALINSYHSFLIPALTPLIFSISVIASLLFLSRSIGPYSMVVGVISGGIGQILFQLPKMNRLGYSLVPSLSLNSVYIKRVIRLWGPIALTSSIFMVTQMIAMKFASGLSDGVLTSLQNALVFFQLPFGVFYGAIATVLFPKMSNQVSEKDIPGLKKTIVYGIQFLLILLIPSAVLLMLYGPELIGTTIQSGKFTIEDTMITSGVLMGYASGLLFMGLYQFIQRIFYAQKEYRIPLVSGLIILVLDVVFSLLLKDKYEGFGLALANTIAFFCGSIFLGIMLRHKIGSISLQPILIMVLKVAVALVPIVLLYVVYRWFTDLWWHDGRTLLNFIKTAGLGIGSGVILLLMYRLLKVEQIDIIMRRRKKNA